MAKKVKKKELGLGIRALLTNIDEETPERQEEVVRELSSTTAMIPIDQIEVNPFQPREQFDEEELEELAQSIRTHGLIQPVTLRRLSENEFQLISGERRLRASKLADLTEIPAYIRLVNDQQMAEMALIENVQRKDLNAIEIAISYQRLIDEFENITHENIGERVGKKRSTITNFLGLLRLPPKIQMALKEQRISMGHAKALRGIQDPALQLSLFGEIESKGLSVRAAEDLVRDYTNPKPAAKSNASTSLPEAYQKIQHDLSNRLETKVGIKVKPGGKGQIVINFGSDQDLNRLLDILEE